MESPAPVAAFAPGGRIGVEADGTGASPDLTWALNLSSVGQIQDDRSASQDALRGIGRLVWRPWYEPTGETPGLLHLGGSGSLALSGHGDVQFRARPESYLTPYLVDTGELAGDGSGLALEAAWQHGPFVLQGELFQVFADADDAGSLYFHGSYVQLAWALTGEARPYDRGKAVFLRLVPRRPFDPRRGQWGALELAGRLSWLDLSDGSVRGGRLFDATVGLTWTLNAWVRLQAGYVYARVRDRPASGGGHILQWRLELRF
jgi:phosphate-selective porin OprO/OprP